MTEKPPSRHGFIKLSRKLFESEEWLAEPFTRAGAWIDLIQMANWEAGTRRIDDVEISLQRGQFVGSVRYLAARWKWHRSKAERCLKWLEKTGRIKGHRARQLPGQLPFLYSIVKYDTYQDAPRHSETLTETLTETNAKKLSSKRKLQLHASPSARGVSKTSPEKPAVKPTWLQEVAAKHEAACGAGTFDYGKSGSILKRLSEHHPGGKIASHYEIYLEVTAMAPQFRNLVKFVENFGEYDPDSFIDPITSAPTAKFAAFYGPRAHA